MALIRNVYQAITTEAGDWDTLLDNAISAASELGILSKGDRVVISAGLPLNVSGNTNTIKVETV